MSTNSVLTPCKQGAVLSRYSIGLGNEYKLRTHTLLFMLMTKQKPKFFRLGCIFFDFRFETIIVLAFTFEVMEEDNLFTRFVIVAI